MFEHGAPLDANSPITVGTNPTAFETRVIASRMLSGRTSSRTKLLAGLLRGIGSPAALTGLIGPFDIRCPMLDLGGSPFSSSGFGIAILPSMVIDPQDFQVVDGVVQLVAVLMMDLFARVQGPAQMLLHQIAVFTHGLAVDADHSIAVLNPASLVLVMAFALIGAGITFVGTVFAETAAAPMKGLVTVQALMLHNSLTCRLGISSINLTPNPLS